MATCMDLSVGPRIHYILNNLSEEIFHSDSFSCKSLHHLSSKSSISSMHVFDYLKSIFKHVREQPEVLSTIILICHFRLMKTELNQEILYKSSLLIYVGLCSSKKQNHVCDIPNKIDAIHYYNYFMNAFVEIQTDYFIFTTSAFSRMVEMMDIDTFLHVVARMFGHGYCSHEIIMKILLMTHYMLRRENIGRFYLLCKVTELLHAPLKEWWPINDSLRDWYKPGRLSSLIFNAAVVHVCAWHEAMTDKYIFALNDQHHLHSMGRQL